MPKTGNIFLNFILFLSIITPVLPAAVIFIKKNYRHESLNFLMILCFLNFLKGLLLWFLPISTGSENLIINIFLLVEFIILIHIFKPSLPPIISRNVNIFLITFLAVIITIFLLRGADEPMHVQEVFESSILIFASIVYLVALAYSTSMQIFNVPLFWISIGTLFYFTILLLIQGINISIQTPVPEEIYSVAFLLNIANIMKYLFYLLAAFFYEPNDR